MRKPGSVVWFDRLFLSARALSLVPYVHSVIRARETGAGPQDLDTVGIAIYHLLLLSPLIPPLLGWFFVSRKASRIACWLVAAFVAYEVLAVAVNTLYSYGQLPGYEFVIFGVTLLDVAAVAMLYRARKWFNQKAKFGAIDPETFT